MKLKQSSQKFVIQIRVYTIPMCRGEEPAFIGEPCEHIVFETQNKEEAYQYFENLKSKDHEIQRKIRHHYFYFEPVKPFFEARLLKYTTKEIELIGWTWMLTRHIDISYRCKIIINGKSYWTKKIYHVPPVLIDSYKCPSDINSREATAFACGILRTFLPYDCFKLEKITSSNELPCL